jgi:predicted nucleic acid-binding protein
LSAIVLDASAGVELVLQTPLGRRLAAKLPAGTTTWVPEHYFTEVAAVLRRHEINGVFAPARIQVALDRLLTASVHRVEVKPLVTEAWHLRHNLTIADALYVVVAQHLQALLVTTDARLARSPGLPVATLTP